MTDKLFYKLWKDALAQPDPELYVAEYGYPNYFDDISSDFEEVVKILRQIHKAAHMSVKDIIKEANLTQAAFSQKFCIPKRTVEGWCMGERKCPDYIRLLICRQLGILEI